METKQSQGYIENLQRSLGYEKVITVELVGLSGGLALFWKECYEVEVLQADKNIIDCCVKLGSINFFVTSISSSLENGVSLALTSNSSNSNFQVSTLLTINPCHQ